jgi:uncharacterized protein (DUF433 family)
MAIGVGCHRRDGAQQWFVGISQGQPIGANDIQVHQWLAVKAILIGGSQRITHNPDQCGGRPCIRGVRIRVQDILALYAAGQSSEQILADFPDLEPEDLKYALGYAAREIDHPVLVG